MNSMCAKIKSTHFVVYDKNTRITDVHYWSSNHHNSVDFLTGNTDHNLTASSAIFLCRGCFIEQIKANIFHQFYIKQKDIGQTVVSI